MGYGMRILMLLKAKTHFFNMPGFPLNSGGKLTKFPVSDPDFEA
jgi:hypothetical protein